MGAIQVETPWTQGGFSEFEIQGKEPTEKELENIHSLVKKIAEGGAQRSSRKRPTEGMPDLAAEVAKAAEERKQRRKARAQLPGQEGSTSFVADNKGEVQNSWFQFLYGRAENNTERESRLEERFGPGTFKNVGGDKYALLLDKIDPHIKEEHGLPLDEGGTIMVNQPGFTGYDVAMFLGGEALPLGVALGVGAFTAGTGIIPSMLFMAAAGAGGKAVDELVVEKLEGHQRQSDDEIYGDVAKFGLFYGLGEGVGRTLFGVGRYLLKGKGPVADPVAVDALKRQGFSNKQATVLAREQAKGLYREAIKEGARPTVRTVSGKAITGRIQAIYEGIFPNNAAAEKNFRYVRERLNLLDDDGVSIAASKKILDDVSAHVSKTVNAYMKDANVDEASKLAYRHLEKVIENEFRLIKDMYVPNEGITTTWLTALSDAGRLFDQDSAWLYQKADDLFSQVVDGQGNTLVKFDPAMIKKAIEKVRDDTNMGRLVGGDIFNSNFFTQMLKRKEDFTFKELMSLRSALQLTGKDPNLMPAVSDLHVGKIIESINSTVGAKLDDLSLFKVQGKYPDLDPAMSNILRDGLIARAKADDFYSKGMDKFKAFATEKLYQDIKAGKMVSNQAVLDTMLTPGSPDKLKFFLDRVTPSTDAAGVLSRTPAPVFQRASVLAGQGRLKEADALLTANGLTEKYISRIPEVVGRLPPDDAYRKLLLTKFQNELDTFARYASQRANPVKYKNQARNTLAAEWLSQTERNSLKDGVFSGTKFAAQFDNLGEPLQKLLFGSTNAAAIKELSRDYYRMGWSNKRFIEEATTPVQTAEGAALRAGAEGIVGGRTLTDEISNLQQVAKTAMEQSEDEFFQAVAKGNLSNADEVVTAVLKNPRYYDRIKNEFGKPELDIPMGFKDMTMARIMEAAFPEGIVGEPGLDRVATGAWAPAMKKAITTLNSNGSLSKILGQDTIDDLLKLSKIGEGISNKALKSQAALAPAAFAAGAFMRFLTNPVAFAGEAVSIYTMGRVMRQKWFLNSLLKPNLRAGFWGVTRKGKMPVLTRGGRKMYQRAVEQGVDINLPPFMGLKQGAAVIEIKERVAQEARMIAAAMARDVTSASGEQFDQALEEYGPGVEEAVQRALPKIQGVTDVVPEGLFGVGGERPGSISEAFTGPRSAVGRAREVLAGEELEKLYGTQ